MTTNIEKIRVLHCITSLDADGAQRMLLKLCENMDAARFEYRVLNLRQRTPFADRFQALGIPVTNLNMSRAVPSLAALWRMRKEIDLFRPHVIQGWMYHGNLAAFAGSMVASHKPKVAWNIRKAVSTAGEYRPLTRLMVRIGAILSRRVEQIIYCGQYVAAQHSALGYCKEKEQVIGNGFDTEIFRPSQEIYRQVRSKLCLPETSLIVGMTARYHAHKDHPNFLHMAARIASLFPDVHFVLAGRGLDAENQTIRHMAANLGLAGRLHLLGEWKAVEQLIPAFDVYCLSSSAEGFPNSLGEAMACGVPCVTTNAGASAEVVGDSGTVVPIGAPLELARAVQEYLQLTSRERQSIGASSRERVIQHFSLRAITAAYEAVYENISVSNYSSTSRETLLEGGAVSEAR